MHSPRPALSTTFPNLDQIPPAQSTYILCCFEQFWFTFGKLWKKWLSGSEIFCSAISLVCPKCPVVCQTCRSVPVSRRGFLCACTRAFLASRHRFRHFFKWRGVSSVAPVAPVSNFSRVRSRSRDAASRRLSGNLHRGSHAWSENQKQSRESFESASETLRDKILEPAASRICGYSLLRIVAKAGVK